MNLNKRRMGGGNRRIDVKDGYVFSFESKVIG